MRHHDRLAMHVLEAVLAHFGQNPVDRGLERRGAAEPVTEGVHEAAETDVREAVSGGGTIEAVGNGAVGRADRRLLGLARSRPESEQGESGQGVPRAERDHRGNS